MPASRAVNSPLNDFPFEMIDPAITLDEDQVVEALVGPVSQGTAGRPEVE